MNAETAENYSWKNKANTIQIKGDSLTPKITKSNFWQPTQEQFLKLTTSTIGPILWKERGSLTFHLIQIFFGSIQNFGR